MTLGIIEQLAIRVMTHHKMVLSSLISRYVKFILRDIEKAMFTDSLWGPTTAGLRVGWKIYVLHIHRYAVNMIRTASDHGE